MVFGQLVTGVQKVSTEDGEPEERIEDRVFIIENGILDFIKHRIVVY